MAAKIKAEPGIAHRPSRNRYRAPLLWLVLPALAGLATSTLPAPRSTAFAPDLALGAALGAVFCSTCRGPWAPRAWGATLLSALVLVGWQLGRRTEPVPPLSSSKGSAPIWADVRVESISPPRAHGPAPRGGHPRWLAAGGIGKVTAISPSQGRLLGQKIYFSMLLEDGAPAPERSSVVRLSGAPRAVPASGGPDSFSGYLRAAGIAAELSPAWLHGEVQPAGWWARHYEALADRMSLALGLGFELRPDLVAIYRAMMLGRKSGLTAGQKELFVATGTMHLFAINGLHIGIVAVSLHALLAALRCPRLVGSAVVLAVLWLDVQSTGAAPSALRAFLMTATAEAAHSLWRPTNPLASLALAAGVLLAADPRAAFGASFQMSFGVVTTLVLLGVPLSAHLQQKYPSYPVIPLAALKPWQRGRVLLQSHLLGAAGFGAAAAAFSAVSGVEYFARFAPSGLIANLVLMPIATLVIIAGFAAIVCGLAHASALSLLFNCAARVLLEIITAALERLAALPGASWTLHYRADWIGPAALCALLATCFWGYAHDWRRDAGGWRPPFLVAGFALLLGARLG